MRAKQKAPSIRKGWSDEDSDGRACTGDATTSEPKREGKFGKSSTQMQPDIYGRVMDEMAYSDNHASPHTRAHE